MWGRFSFAAIGLSLAIGGAAAQRPSTLPEWRGWASLRQSLPPPQGKRHSVGSLAELRAALATSSQGEVIELRPGTYLLSDQPLAIARPGSPAAPITLWAERLGSVVIQSTLPEAIKVTAQDWRFENLVIHGACPDDNRCDHAFHIAGAADRIVIRATRLEDFNAAIKINGENGRFPDDGRIEASTLANHLPRHTENSVTPIDLVAASGWHITGNLIADFAKDGGNRVAYGAFAKGGGSNNVFDRNVVLCTWRLPADIGQQVGLSFGGGGTERGLGRDPARAGPEQTNGVMRDNLIAFCGDVGIYLNRAAGTRLTHNTLLATVGIDVRFPESTADVDDNLVAGRLRTRDGGIFSAAGNLTGPHVSALFVDPTHLDLRWRDKPATGASDSDPDLCGPRRAGPSVPGAFEDFAACLR